MQTERGFYKNPKPMELFNAGIKILLGFEYYFKKHDNTRLRLREQLSESD